MARILIIEDSQTEGRAVSELLQSAGHECAHELTGRDGVARAVADRPDLVVLDVMLPDISGFEVCRRIRRHDTIFETPILIVSAMSGEEEMMHGLLQGADDFLEKPYDKVAFLERINLLLRSGDISKEADPLTQLPGAGQMKKILQQRVQRGDAFEVAYVELLNFRKLLADIHIEGRNKVVRHFARTLGKAAASMDDNVFSLAHMGGGHFVCLTPLGAMESYAADVRQLWRNHLSTLCREVTGLSYKYEQAMENSPDGIPVGFLDTLFAVTRHRAGETASSGHQLLETLSHVRSKALTARRGGICFDRRN